MLPSSSFYYSHPVPKTLPRCSFQTLASTPPLFSLSAAGRRLSVLSSLIYRSQPHRRPRLLLASFYPAPRAFSSASSGQELEWRVDQHLHQPPQEYHSLSPAPPSCSVDQDRLLGFQQEKRSRFIPVKAYFLCTSVDLRNLQSQNAFNVVPPSSRATNYLVLRY
ncbi:hypothetical protein COCNU_contig69490076G000010 [Cocos nucifera]|nr:hypothetical protein [Cocos nucifera]